MARARRRRRTRAPKCIRHKGMTYCRRAAKRRRGRRR